MSDEQQTEIDVLRQQLRIALADVDALRGKVESATKLGIVFDDPPGTAKNVLVWDALADRGQALDALRWVATGVPPDRALTSPTVLRVLAEVGRDPPTP